MASLNRLNKRISTGAPRNNQNNATRVFYINASVTNVPIFVVASRDTRRYNNKPFYCLSVAAI